MVGFDRGQEEMQELDDNIVQNINADLTARADLTMRLRLKENEGISFMGPSAKAPFDVDARTAEWLMSQQGNPNGRPNLDVVRPVYSAVDLTKRSREKWTIDFGFMPIEDASQYHAPFEYVKEHVYPIRSKNRRRAYAEKWWQYAEARPGMRQALEGLSRFVATPGVSKHRVFVWVDSKILCNQGTLVFAREDDYFFGVLHSKIHELWALRQGTQLEDRPRYTPTTCFETFPFPWPPGEEPSDEPIVRAVEKRDRWLNPEGASEVDLKKRTLTSLYNQRPTWLDLAHKKLDEAVLDSYAWPHNLSDEDILERLLNLNLERAATEGDTK